MVTGRSRKRILVSPLDWGLGHATRCIPLIRMLRDRGHEVVIGGEGAHADLLIREFPDIECVALPNYNITYASSPLLLKLKFPFMVRRVYRCAREEHRALRGIVDKHKIDVVISDQRFGCYSGRIKSIYLTHQLCVKMPLGFGWLEAAVARALRKGAEKFDQTWIPDYPGDDNLTGDLTRKYPLPANHRFIGPQSRFSPKTESDAERVDLLVMLSGPEPSRSLLQRRILAQLGSFDGSAVVLLGSPGTEPPRSTRDTIRIYPHLPSEKMESLIRGADSIVCRGGYTTIMELVSLGKTAVLVPTPGQTEQEYLCTHLARRGWFVCEQQSSLDVVAALHELSSLPSPLFPSTGIGLLEQVVRDAVQ